MSHFTCAATFHWQLDIFYADLCFGLTEAASLKTSSSSGYITDCVCSHVSGTVSMALIVSADFFFFLSKITGCDCIYLILNQVLYV